MAMHSRAFPLMMWKCMGGFEAEMFADLNFMHALRCLTSRPGPPNPNREAAPAKSTGSAGDKTAAERVLSAVEEWLDPTLR